MGGVGAHRLAPGAVAGTESVLLRALLAKVWTLHREQQVGPRDSLPVAHQGFADDVGRQGGGRDRSTERAGLAGRKGGADQGVCIPVLLRLTARGGGHQDDLGLPRLVLLLALETHENIERSAALRTAQRRRSGKRHTLGLRGEAGERTRRAGRQPGLVRARLHLERAAAVVTVAVLVAGGIAILAHELVRGARGLRAGCLEHHVALRGRRALTRQSCGRADRRCAHRSQHQGEREEAAGGETAGHAGSHFRSSLRRLLRTIRLHGAATAQRGHDHRRILGGYRDEADVTNR